MKKLLLLLFVFPSLAFASGGNYTTPAFYRSGGSIFPNVSSDDFGSSGTRIDQMWSTFLDTTYASSTSVTTTNYAAFATSAGNVGIGTTSPGTKFSVHGAGLVSSAFSVGGTLTATSSAFVATEGGALGVATTSTLGILNLGNGVGTATTTVVMSRIQFDGYNSAGSRVCVEVVTLSFVITAGACNP